MSFVSPLLSELVRLRGDALVIHSGERAYVAIPAGRIVVSERRFTLVNVLDVARQLLPTAAQIALDELGTAEHELPPAAGDHHRLTIVAARNGDVAWMEVRRFDLPDGHRVPEEDRVPEELFVPANPPPDAPPLDADLGLPDASHLWPDERGAFPRDDTVEIPLSDSEPAGRSALSAEIDTLAADVAALAQQLDVALADVPADPQPATSAPRRAPTRS
jgi:hypothetical protein